MNSRKISLRAVARDLNISAMTLYRVLNNTPGVSHETRMRVTAALDKAGVLLSRNKTQQSVLIDIQDDAYKQRLAFSLLNRISDLGYNILISNSRKDKAAFLRMADHADTAVFFSSPSASLIEDLRKVNPELFRINVSGGSGGDIIVGINNYMGGRMAAEYLYRCGHRDMAAVTMPVEPTQLDRHKSFIGELAVLNPDHPVHCFYPLGDTIHIGAPLIRLIREKGVTAFFCTCDYIGFQVLRNLHEAGIRIPEDVSILSYDFPEESVMDRPIQLDTIAFDQEQIVRMVEYYLVNRQISSKPLSWHCLIEPELKRNGSVKCIKNRKATI